MKQDLQKIKCDPYDHVDSLPKEHTVKIPVNQALEKLDLNKGLAGGKAVYYKLNQNDGKVLFPKFFQIICHVTFPLFLSIFLPAELTVAIPPVVSQRAK